MVSNIDEFLLSFEIFFMFRFNFYLTARAQHTQLSRALASSSTGLTLLNKFLLPFSVIFFEFFALPSPLNLIHAARISMNLNPQVVQ